MADQKTMTNGEAAAAILAAGIGSLVLGAVTVVAEASVPIREVLNFYSPVGPLSGKTLVMVVGWLVAWAALNGLWKGKQVDFPKVFIVTLILIALGLLGTFPVFFEMFG